jgi:phosphohistidine phosphatase
MAPTERHLVILRHAKSAWPDGLPDAQRPLTKRGVRDARAAGRWLHDHVGSLDAVVCSSAERTRQTWALVSDVLTDPPRPTYDDRIYGAPPDVLLDVVRDLADDVGTALLIGHNPGVEELVGLLSGQWCGMGTSSVAVLSWPGSWVEAAPQVADLRDHITPRG